MIILCFANILVFLEFCVIHKDWQKSGQIIQNPGTFLLLLQFKVNWSFYLPPRVPTLASIKCSLAIILNFLLLRFHFYFLIHLLLFPFSLTSIAHFAFCIFPVVLYSIFSFHLLSSLFSAIVLFISQLLCQGSPQ